MVHIKELIIIGGPSCVGKSFLIKKIQQGKYPDLCKQLGISNPSSWRYVHAVDLNNIEPENIDKLVVHYDFYTQKTKNNEFNYLQKIISHSENTVIVTLKVPRSILVQRVNLRLCKCSLVYLSTIVGIKQDHHHLILRQKIYGHWQKCREYMRGENDTLYQIWFDFLKQFNLTNHWLLDNSKSSTISAYPYQNNQFFYTSKKYKIESDN